jgi:3-(3-hydroxy-phenyl)propionate hydroxylase
MASERPPILIAGAGPTGLMCALALGKQGIPVEVCEAEHSLAHDLRAGSYHPPTQEMMAKYGITQRMHEHGLQVRRWQIRERRGDLVAQFDLGLLSDVTAYPYRLHLEQHRLTPIQLDILRKETNAKVHFGHRVIGFEQKGDSRGGSLRVKVENDGIPGTIEASWLIGADGGRSTIRKLLPVEFEGFTWPEQFLVVSTPYDFGQHGYALNAYIADPVEWSAVFKMPDAGPPGVWRVVFPTDTSMPDDELLDPKHVESKMQRFHARSEPYQVRHKVIYRVHQRVASEWRLGRVLLAGDAAHLNNPLGAFGLNSGIHDAVNLADKLGRVWRGEAGEELLDLYVRQRRVACIDSVQAISIRNKRLLEERDPKVQRAHMQELIEIANDPVRSRAHLLDSSMISGLRKSEDIR